MIKTSLSVIAPHIAGVVLNKDAIFQGISIDTRTLVPGNLFIALQGEQMDGYDFIADALKKGASAALVNRPSDVDIPQLMVSDILQALGKISDYWRTRFKLPIIGVTGSNGKTTLKNMIAAILRAACDADSNQALAQVLATEGNFNNNIGVPLMLCRLNEHHRYAVIEMGMNHFGEIAYLTHLTQPQVAIINNAGSAHLKELKDVAGVARAKGEIFLGLTDDGTAILNRDDAYFKYWHDVVKKNPAHSILTFGTSPEADVTGIFYNNHLTIETLQGKIDVNLPLLGKHNMMNALAATAATLVLHIDLNQIKKGLESIQPAHGRLEQHLLTNGVCVIDDTYNANPASTEAAIDTLMTFTGEKIMVLGDMKELGSEAKAFHHAIGKKLQTAGIQHLFTLGEMSLAATEVFGQHAHHFITHQQLIAALQPYLKKGVTVLIKGSRSMKMETIVSALVAHQEESLDR